MSVVFVVNADVTASESLVSVIRTAGWYPETFECGRAFLDQPRTRVPSCLLLDVELPDMSGLDLQAMFADRPEMPVIFTAKYPMLRAAVLAIKAGALEFLPEPLDEDLLLGAIHTALDRSHAALARGAEIGSLIDRYASLTPREREIMAKVVAGRLNKLIAADLGISMFTVKSHRGRVMRKMQAPSLAGLIDMANRLRSTAASPRNEPTRRKRSRVVSPALDRRGEPCKHTGI
jgi:FixJ family two-component response regulator